MDITTSQQYKPFGLRRHREDNILPWLMSFPVLQLSSHYTLIMILIDYSIGS